MRTLPEYAKTLLLQGASTLGNFTDGFDYIEERVKATHYGELRNFCKWIDANIGGASRFNIDMLYAAFKNPTDLNLKAQANELASKIKSLKLLITS